MDEYVVVLVTVGNAEEADRISQALVEERLAACCTRIPAVRSVYRWEGRVCDEEEVLLVIKTRRGVWDRLTSRVHELHSYDMPEIIALPLVAGSERYLRWISDNVVL
jgi:periplasmic divalent cation tolerance protein